MDQSLIAGIGNIYSDEMLWAASIHPLSKPAKVPEKSLKKLYEEMKKVLEKGIDFGGDSMSDYRNIHGVRGKFQNEHNVYQLKGEKCRKIGCGGTIERIKVGGRSGHFCPKHQKLFA
jgi:formamidopyrimidine-DNA glycosylase